MLSDHDIALFRQAITGAKEIKQNTATANKMITKRIASEKNNPQQIKNIAFYFSDEYEPLIDENNGVVKYLRKKEAPYLLKQLAMGYFSPSLFLDLHGLTRQQSKLELAALLHTCEQEKIECAAIMTGYGGYVLKKQVPRWLVQHPDIRALHQAPKKWGGNSAILILFDTKRWVNIED